jgi:hypothetical protein
MFNFQLASLSMKDYLNIEHLLQPHKEVISIIAVAAAAWKFATPSIAAP